MIEIGRKGPRFANGSGASVVVSAVVALGLLFISVGCQAAGTATPLAPLAPPNIPPILASFVALSDAAMAREAGTNLGPPTIAHDPVTHPTVLLWDELRPVPQLPNGPSGSVSITIGTGK